MEAYTTFYGNLLIKDFVRTKVLAEHEGYLIAKGLNVFGSIGIEMTRQDRDILCSYIWNDIIPSALEKTHIEQMEKTKWKRFEKFNHHKYRGYLHSTFLRLCSSMREQNYPDERQRIISFIFSAILEQVICGHLCIIFRDIQQV